MAYTSIIVNIHGSRHSHVMAVHARNVQEFDILIIKVDAEHTVDYCSVGLSRLFLQQQRMSVSEPIAMLSNTVLF